MPHLFSLSVSFFYFFIYYYFFFSFFSHEFACIYVPPCDVTCPLALYSSHLIDLYQLRQYIHSPYIFFFWHLFIYLFFCIFFSFIAGVLGSLTRLVLVNAVYFKGLWAKQFDAQHTRDADFWLTLDSSIKVPTMFVKSQFQYKFLKELNAGVLAMDYKVRTTS